MSAALTLQHPYPFQVWRLGRGHRPVELLSRHSTQEAAVAAAQALRGSRGVCDVTRPLAGWIVTWSWRTGAQGLGISRRLEACERLRRCAPGTPIADLDLSPERARRAARALDWGHLGGTQARWGVPVEPADRAIVLHRARLVVSVDGAIEADPTTEPARLVVAVRTLEDWHGGTASRRALRRLLGWSLRRVGEVLVAAEELGYVTLGETGRIGVTRAGRLRVRQATPEAQVAPIGGAA